MNKVDKWYLDARYKYVWDKDTFADYVEVFAEVVRSLIKEHTSDSQASERLVSPSIGLFKVLGDKKPKRALIGYALYVADTRLSNSRSTLFSRFKDAYRIHIGADELTGWMFNKDILTEAFPDKVEFVTEYAKKRSKLVRHFESLANKSLNHNRRISARVRCFVLKRDNSTCKMCGRRPPAVRVHVDHILPVSRGLTWEPSNDPNDYQVLCEECNMGKGDMTWMLDIA